MTFIFEPGDGEIFTASSLIQFPRRGGKITNIITNIIELLLLLLLILWKAVSYKTADNYTTLRHVGARKISVRYETNDVIIDRRRHLLVVMETHY